MQAAERAQVPARSGLTAAEVADRVARGLVNDVPSAPTRTIGEIVKANLLTRFNLLLGSLLAVILVVGPLQDALFGLVIVANTMVGIVQEVRAKRTLDHLEVVNAPRARVVRDGRVEELAVGQVVLDDVLEAAAGDQVVVDGEVLEAGGLEVDESLLTGESEPVSRQEGDRLLSGSFVAAGAGRYRATRVGREAYAVQLTEEARRFTLARSELRAGVDQILKYVTWALVPTAALLFISQLRHDNGARAGLSGAVAGTVAMIPEGLVLLTSVAFAVGVVRLGRRQVLVRELPAVETLARVDVVCFDKTGTITAGDLAVQELMPQDGAADEAAAALGALAAADPNPNATLRAIGEAFPAPDGWRPETVVPFSSARKWSGATFARRGAYLLGAPEVLLHGGQLLRRAEAIAAQGGRVVLLAHSERPMDGVTPPDGLVSRAMVVIGDQVRDDAATTIAWFAEEGVRVKVVSGDHPRTVAAIAGRVGIQGAGDPVDARTLPTDAAELADLVEARSVFGRVVPQQKRAMVGALGGRGHVVAMTGDGVNDVLALKDADLGIAMGSGSSASRAVAELVLMDGRFATLPAVMAEGRRVIANIERVAKLFVTKTVYATVLALAVGLAGLAFPFLPRHLTLISSLTIGIPGFFLALEPNTQRSKPGFVPRTLAFAIPAGLAAALATLVAYQIADVENVSTEQARTTATLALAGLGLVVLALAARPLNPLRRLLLGVMAGAFVVVLVVPGLRVFFALSLPPLPVALATLGLVVVLGAALALVVVRLRV
ncbi:MAG TPA: HAD-IC family P-type ATPase [Actinomycetes bacterium]|jgi:cation-transporting ATPase E|nr:HAD-IC family P-type ATPase [Actinomycetes bacterium]